ncbi:hypothetical protein IGK51_001485 [Enterococcus sp. DIV0098]
MKKVIDIFPSRNQEEVTGWLSSTCQDLSFVIRGGAASFRNAISQAFPDAIQVADRFHVLKSLTEHALKAIRPLIPKEICTTVGASSQPPKRVLTPSQQRKQELAQKVKEKKQLGWSYKKIGDCFSLDPRTVKRYCNPTDNVFDDHNRKDEHTRLDDYQELLVQLMVKHQTLKPIYTALVESGYDRTFDTFRKTYKKTLSKQFVGNSLTKVYRKPINRLVFESTINHEDLDDITEMVLNDTPELTSIIQCVQEFRKILADVSLLALDHWIDQARSLKNTELDAFINGLERDKDAIQNAMIFPELSNGLAEGKVNKLKKIKRIMFGRCSFQTLRTKMILSEL